MSRSCPTLMTALVCGAILALPALAQQTKPTPVQGVAPADSPVPGSEEWERQRGETYRFVPDNRQSAAELAETSKLNAGVIAQNEEAARTEAEIIGSNDAAREHWQAETDRIEADNARIAAENAAAEAQYQRDMTRYEQSIAVCERAGGRDCRVKP